MSASVESLLRTLWLDLWNRRAMDDMLALLEPDYETTDHRLIGTSSGDKGAWRELSESWWRLVPDAQITELDILAIAEDRVAYILRGEGTDSISGGPNETVFYAANCLRNERLANGHLFDDPDQALDWLHRTEGSARRGETSHPRTDP